MCTIIATNNVWQRAIHCPTGTDMHSALEAAIRNQASGCWTSFNIRDLYIHIHLFYNTIYYVFDKIYTHIIMWLWLLCIVYMWNHASSIPHSNPWATPGLGQWWFHFAGAFDAQADPV